MSAHADEVPDAALALRARLGATPARDPLDEVSRHYVLHDGQGGVAAALRVTRWTRAEVHRLVPLPVAPPETLLGVAGTASYVVSRGGPGELARLIEFAWRREYAEGGRLDLAAVRLEIAPLYVRLGYVMIGEGTVRHPRTGAACRMMALVSGAVAPDRRLAEACPRWDDPDQLAAATRFLGQLSESLG